MFGGKEGLKMNKIAYIVLALLMLACSCHFAPLQLIEYRGPDVYEGEGGTVETVDGIDFWTTGTPNCKFKVLGFIDYNPASHAVDTRISKKILISKVKEVGGDGVVIVDKKTRASGIYDFMGDAHISYSTDYWMAVVKYLETGSEKLLNQGIALLEGGQYDRAIAIFDEALEINPRYAEAYNFRGVAYDEKGQYDQAISDYTKVIELNPRLDKAYMNRGVAYDNKGQYDKAISDYTKAIEINPSNDIAYSNRGLLYGKKGQYDQAISDYTKVIELNPRSAETYYPRGVIYFYKREYEKAWDDVHKVQNLGLQIHPEFLKALREASGRQE